MTAETSELTLEKKNILKSKRFLGFALVAFEIAEILTGDPLSLNGAIKWILFCSGSGLWLWGELAASKLLNYRFWQW